jgi:predicted ATPase
MSKSDAEQIGDAVNRFIDLANTLKNDGVDVNIVATALMSASGIYSTYAAGGNQGGLTPAGVEKVADAYKKELSRIQDVKRANAGKL